jgi:hypothetical protein
MAIFTAIGTAIAGAIFAGSALAATVISAGLAVGAQLAISYFTRKKQPKNSAAQQPQEKRIAISGQIQFGADVSVWTVYGTAAVTGHRAYYAAWGTGDAYNAEVFILANGRCEGLLNEVYFYGQKHTLVSAATIGDEDEHWKVSGFGDLISIRFFAGRDDQLADARLVSVTSGSDNPWTSTDRLTGMAYVVVERQFDEGKFSDGRPQFKWALKGLRCYDWRKDSTVSGGSGTHRLANPDTWEHTNNPAICRANYELGLKGLASDRAIIGMGKTFGELHLSSYTVAANACDADRTKNARTFDTYQIGMIVDADSDFTEVLRDFDDAMAGYSFNASGLSGIIVGAPQSSAFTITADDIRMDGQKSIKYRRDSPDLYNYLTGSFTSRESLWEAESLAPVTVNADVSADKRRRSMAYDFLQVNDPDVAQYLLNVRYRQGRKGGFATVPVSKRLAYQAEAGDWCTYLSKTWIVMGRRFSNDGWVLELAETGSDVYSETGIVAGPIITAPSPPVFFEQTTVSNLAVQATVVSGANDLPAMKVTWTPPDDPRVDAVVIEYRIAGETTTQRVRDDSPEDGEITIAPLASAGDYEVRATIVTTPSRPTTFTNWVAITTSEVNSNIVIPDTSLSLAKLDQDVQGLFSALNQLRQDSLTQRDIIDDSMFTSQSVDLLERYVEDRDTRAFVATESTVRVTEEEALAALITTVSTTLDGNSADISWVQTSENGQAVRFGILGNINGETGGFQFTGINLDGETSYTFEIDGDLIVDGTITSDKLQANELSAITADLGTVTAGKMQSTDGKMVIDLDNKIIRITA